MSELELPAKRGTFVEFRTGLINLCPVGRSCSYEERLAFAAFDQEHSVRLKFKEALEREFGELGQFQHSRLRTVLTIVQQFQDCILPWEVRYQ